MDVSIRLANSGDIAAVDALLAYAYPKMLKEDYPPSVLVTALPLISRAQPQLVSGGSYFVAETQDGQVVSAGGITADRQIRGKGHVRHVVTDPNFARQGIGRQLMTHALQFAAGKNMGTIECWSTYTAERFYGSLGFVRLGLMEVPLQAGITFPAVRMRLLLANET